MRIRGERVAASAGVAGVAFAVLLAVGILAAGCGGSGGGGGRGAGAAAETYPITLSWDPVSTNDDGTPIVDLVGYRVYDGPESGHYTMMTELPNVTTATIELSRGTFFISVTAYDASGNESGFSNEVAITVP